MKNRQRGRSGKQRPPGRNPNFDGNNARPRGNAQQLMEKYLSLARDATSAGDRVLAEGYFQHADHYYRVLNARFEQQNNNNNNNNGQRRFQDNGQGQGYDRQGYNQDRDDGNDQQPQHYNQQPQQHYNQHQPEPPSNNYQPQQQPSIPPAPEAEIGLPPTLLGIEASSEPAAEPADGQNSAPREDGRSQQGRRRGRGRGERSFSGAAGE